MPEEIKNKIIDRWNSGDIQTHTDLAIYADSLIYGMYKPSTWREQFNKWGLKTKTSGGYQTPQHTKDIIASIKSGEYDMKAEWDLACWKIAKVLAIELNDRNN